MLTMRSKILVLMMIAGFFVYFAGTNSAQAAGDEVPTECTNGLGWTTELLGVVQTDECNIDPCYIWTYRVQSPQSNTKGLNHINFNISARLLNGEFATQVGEYDKSATVAAYIDGAGDPTTSFGKGILQYYVVKFTPQSTDGTWSFISNTEKMATATVGLKINYNLGICEIGVPDMPSEPEFAAMAVSSLQIIKTTDGKEFKIEEDPSTQCILNAYKVVNGVETKLTKVAIETLLLDEHDDTAAIEFVGVPGQGCPRSIIKREGENTWYFISGRYVWR